MDAYNWAVGHFGEFVDKHTGHYVAIDHQQAIANSHLG